MSELQSADAPAVPSSASGSAESEPRGIGGWLLVAALAQLFGPLRLLVLLGRDYLNPENKEALEQFPIAGYGELVLNVGLLLLMTVTAVLFFRTSRHFPRFFICTLITVVIFPVLTSAWLALALSFELDEPFGDHFVFEGPDVAQIGFAAIWALIWIPYTVRSKRVKNTFGAPALAAEETTGPVSWMLLTVVCFFVVSGLFGVLAGLGHMYGRGVFSGQLIGGALQIALAVWLFRGSNIARALLAILSFVGAGLFGALVIFFPGEPAAIMLWLALTAMSVAMVWMLVFSKRFRAELALNAAKYRDPELAVGAGER